MPDTAKIVAINVKFSRFHPNASKLLPTLCSPDYLFLLNTTNCVYIVQRSLANATWILGISLGFYFSILRTKLAILWSHNIFSSGICKQNSIRVVSSEAANSRVDPFCPYNHLQNCWATLKNDIFVPFPPMPMLFWNKYLIELTQVIRQLSCGIARFTRGKGEEQRQKNRKS